MSIELDPEQFEGTVDFKWYDSVLHQYKKLEGIDNRILYLESLIPKLKYLASLKSIKEKMVTATIVPPSLNVPIICINSHLMPQLIQKAYDNVYQMCKFFCHRFAISTEISLVDACIKRKKKGLFIVHGPANYEENLITSNCSGRQHQDGSYTIYDSSLFKCRVQVHFHIIMDEDSYLTMKKRTKKWRTEQDYYMKKSPGFLLPEHVDRFGQYTTKANILPQTSRISFNRYRFDLPFTDEKSIEIRSRWMKEMRLFSNFTGKCEKINTLIIYLKSVIKSLYHFENCSNSVKIQDVGEITAHRAQSTLAKIYKNTRRWGMILNSVSKYSETLKKRKNDKYPEIQELLHTLIAYDTVKSYALKSAYGTDPP